MLLNQVKTNALTNMPPHNFLSQILEHSYANSKWLSCNNNSMLYSRQDL